MEQFEIFQVLLGCDQWCSLVTLTKSFHGVPIEREKISCEMERISLWAQTVFNTSIIPT